MEKINPPRRKFLRAHPLAKRGAGLPILKSLAVRFLVPGGYCELVRNHQ